MKSIRLCKHKIRTTIKPSKYTFISNRFIEYFFLSICHFIPFWWPSDASYVDPKSGPSAGYTKFSYVVLDHMASPHAPTTDTSGQ